MFVREDAADGDEDDENEHDYVEENQGEFVFDVFREENHRAEENRRGDHRVRRREARFAGAVGAGVQNENVVKNEPSDDD